MKFNENLITIVKIDLNDAVILRNVWQLNIKLNLFRKSTRQEYIQGPLDISFLSL